MSGKDAALIPTATSGAQLEQRSGITPPLEIPVVSHSRGFPVKGIAAGMRNKSNNCAPFITNDNVNCQG